MPDLSAVNLTACACVCNRRTSCWPWSGMVHLNLTVQMDDGLQCMPSTCRVDCKLKSALTAPVPDDAPASILRPSA